MQVPTPVHRALTQRGERPGTPLAAERQSLWLAQDVGGVITHTLSQGLELTAHLPQGRQSVEEVHSC